MYQLKASLLIVFIIAALTGAILCFTEGSSVLSPSIVEAEHARVQDIMSEKLANAEHSLNDLAQDLATDEKLVQELAYVREKLQTSTAEELKRNTNNKWNTAVFDRLISWKETQQSGIKQRTASLNDTMRARTSSMLAQKPAGDWWQKAPDLVLAFAAVPLANGVISSVLVANGEKGKELNGGKSYEEEIEVLALINQNHRPQFGHFNWGTKMYMSVVAPVMNQNSYVGSVVVGVELSRDMITAFSKSLPGYVHLMFAYSAPKFGEESSSKRQQNYSDVDSADLKVIESTQFHVNSSVQQEGNVKYDMIPANQVYAGSLDGDREVALSRVRWTWNEKEETDVYVVSDTAAANHAQDKLRIQVMVAGLIALLLGIILAVLLVNSIMKRVHMVKEALANAITSGDPIDSKAIAWLVGEEDVGQYTIKPVEAAPEDTAESWTDMMVDFSDEANNKADEALKPEEAQNLKESADAEEARPIYEEYMRLRKENNINTPMDFDCFLRRLQRNAAKIKAQYHCENVTFQVHVSDGNVLLKPKIVKK